MGKLRIRCELAHWRLRRQRAQNALMTAEQLSTAPVKKSGRLQQPQSYAFVTLQGFNHSGIAGRNRASSLICVGCVTQIVLMFA